MNTPRQIILASGSPRRAELLRTFGLPFEVLVSAAEELEDHDRPPEEVARLNARRKAEAVARQHPAALVLGADTVVASQGRLFGKPRDLTEAGDFLLSLSGETHAVITAVCVVEDGGARLTEFAETTHVTFKKLSLETVAEYLRRVEVLDKAGAYAIQEHGDLIIEKIAGSRTNVIGLPLEGKLREILTTDPTIACLTTPKS